MPGIYEILLLLLAVTVILFIEFIKFVRATKKDLEQLKNNQLAILDYLRGIADKIENK